jgi:peptide/nickel transport system ATP-binding protein
VSVAAVEAPSQEPVAAQGPVLDVRDFHLTFDGGVRALRGVDLRVAPGEIVGLVGESGSGKTVLGLSALGLVSGGRSEGSVELGGIDMASAPEPERRARRGLYVGAVFQDPMAALNPAMRIGRQVAEAADTRDLDVVHGLLADAGIPNPQERARQFPHELSGGLRQRVTIAMAVARSPRLVIADEPTTALDVTVQARVLALLASLRERGISVLLITHDLAVAGSICDRVVVAYAGRIAESGTVREVLGAPRHPYTVGLLASRPLMTHAPGEELASLPGRMPDPRMLPSGCAFAPRCPLAGPVCDEQPLAPAEGRAVECHRAGELETWPRAAAEPPAPAPAAAAAEHAEGGVSVRAEGVTRDFGGRKGRLFVEARAPFRAVDDVSFELPRGGALAIVGESGSGKTTLLRMVVGLLAPTSGTITRGLGAPPQLVFQDAGASLTPWLSVGQMLDERLTRAGVAPGRREKMRAETLDAVGLPLEIVRRRPRELSGGQRQRAAIARAVIVPPTLLACDEPVSALDVSLAAQVLNLLGDLRRRLGLSLLFVTHDLAVARAVAEDVIVMHGGRIVERGPVERVLGDPQHEYTRELLDAVPRLPGQEAA